MENYLNEMEYMVNKTKKIKSMFDVMANDRNHFFSENLKANFRCAELTGVLIGIIKSDSIGLEQRKAILDLLIGIYDNNCDKEIYSNWIKEWNKLKEDLI